MKKPLFSTLCAGICLGLAGCCDDVCDAYGDLKVDIANNYAVCCQTGTDDDWNECIQDAQERHNELRDTLIAAEAACRNNQNDLAEELLRDFYELLRGRITEAVGPVALRSGNAIVNTFVILEPTDLIDFAMTAEFSTSSIQKIQPFLVDGVRYSAESAGIAIEAATLYSDDGNPPVSSIEPFTEATANLYRFHSSGQISVSTDPYDRTLSVIKGDLTITDYSADGVTRLVPTNFAMILQGDGMTVTLTLDQTSPYNELVLDDTGNGYLGLTVSLNSQSQGLNRLNNLGSFWMILPASQNTQGDLTFNTNGWTIGTDIFPLQPATLAVTTGQTGELPSLPNGREESCADVDGNGIRDGADELINNYDNLTDCN